MTAEAAVTYDPARPSPDALVERVRATGYGASLPQAGGRRARGAGRRARRDEFRELRAKAVVALAAGVVAMLVSMPLMAAHAHLGRRAGRPVHALEHARPRSRCSPGRCRGCTRSRRARSPSGSLALTTAVMAWAGRHFYTRAWAAFRHHSADMNTLVAVGTGAAYLLSLVATARAGLLRRARRPARRVLRGGRPHHRAHPRRQHARGAREAADVGGAAARSCSSSRRRARVVRGGAERDVPIEEVQPGDVSSSAPASGSRSTARSCPATSAVDESMLTGEPLPVDEAAGRRGRRRARSTAPARSATARPPSAPTACSPAS